MQARVDAGMRVPVADWFEAFLETAAPVDS